MFPHRKPFIVAEIGASHNGSYSRAVKLIEAAKAAGADAVKFQTYYPEEIAVDVPIVSGPWAGRTYHELYREAAMPWVWYETLFGHARKIGIIPFATPFSIEAVVRLQTVHCPIFKIASSEITYLPLIKAAAQTGKPLIISTGMATFHEIMNAVRAAEEGNVTNLTVLHCIAAYPAYAKDFNLDTMRHLTAKGFKVGLSDHSLDPVAAIMAVALGAAVIEKHFTLSRDDGGPDAAFSLEPHEFSKLVYDCRMAASAMGTSTFGVREAEKESEQYRRSIWITRDIKAGEYFTEANMAILRPNYGLAPNCWDKLLGKRALCDIPAKTPTEWRFVL
jgi:N-acetylneuraminate synthase